jgi:hypothetical protein
MAISYPISLVAINAEVDSVNSGSLTSLSTNAIEGLSTLNESPYAMSEFNNYSHTFTTTYSCGTLGGGGGAKGGGNVRNTADPSDTSWPLGNAGGDWTISYIRSGINASGITVATYKSGYHYLGSTDFATGWTSITSAGTNAWTLNRTSFTITYNSYNSNNNTTYVYFNISSGSYLASSGSGTYTLNV